MSGNNLRTVPSSIGQLVNLIFLDLSRNSLRSAAAVAANATVALTPAPATASCAGRLGRRVSQGSSLTSRPGSSNHSSGGSAGGRDDWFPSVAPAHGAHVEGGEGSPTSQPLPDEMAALTRLEELNLAECSLYSLPPVIFNITSLRRLNLSQNHFKELPEEVSLARLPYSGRIECPGLERWDCFTRSLRLETVLIAIRQAASMWPLVFLGSTSVALLLSPRIGPSLKVPLSDGGFYCSKAVEHSFSQLPAGLVALHLLLSSCFHCM
ncbi:unnamed protein product [Protopolystoma xenopodis]|uniref:Uncharacterized protein n=1 Tax=Protopolystoma xenopodis TaxID=117903 RepID=A0A3S5CSV8_9PLAT|nr:unnamed protein product [Protopolystoma xenopodis]